MTLQILFVLACWGLAFLVAHAWWMKFRVEHLRLDFAETQDWLQRQVRALHGESDPGYLRAMQLLENLQDAAPLITWPGTMYLEAHAEEFENTIIAERPEVQAVVDEATAKASHHIVHHLLCRTLTGLALRCFFQVFLSTGEPDRPSEPKIERAIRSGIPGASLPQGVG